jgi:putative ABC transport system substrate-binding protein
VALAARHAIPACYAFREFAVAGGLMSFGPDLVDSNRQAGLYAARILKGANPATLPIIQAEKFELVINRNTAKKLGIPISRDFVARVNEVIE